MQESITVYLESAAFSRWTFRHARLATLDACMQLYPGDQAKFASVMNGWVAVGVREPAEGEQPAVESVVRADASPQLPIPDATPRGITSVLTLSGIGQIRGVKVAVDIAHTCIRDLRVILTAPDGKTFPLHDKASGNTQNIVATYDVSNTPGLAELQGGSFRATGRFRCRPYGASMSVSCAAGAPKSNLRTKLKFRVHPRYLFPTMIQVGSAVPWRSRSPARSAISRPGWISRTHGSLISK